MDACRRTTLVFVLVLGAVGAGQVGAQVLEEVVVTAQKREQSLQDVPISVIAIGGDKIQTQSIGALEDLSAYVPNVTITRAATGDQLFIRGIGSGFNPGFEQSVGQFIDGIYHGRGFQSRSQFLDVERVEVLRGPQSTYFGNNTIAGALNITTRKPTEEVEGYVDAFFEPDLGERSIDFALGGPITPTLAGRVATRFSGIDGWLQNTAQNRDEPDEDNKVGRATFVWTPNDVFDATLKAETGSFNVEGRGTQFTNCPPPADLDPARTSTCETLLGLNAFGILPGGFEADFDESKSESGFGAPTAALASRFARQQEDTQTKNYTMTLNYDVAGHTLTSVTGLSGYDNNRSRDVDFTTLAVIHETTDEEFDQWSQELRIASPLGGRFEYLAGFYWQQSDLDIAEQAEFLLPTIVIPAFGPLPPIVLPATAAAAASQHAQDEETWAVFGSITWNVMERLRATFGFRYTETDKEIDRTQIFTAIGNPGTAICADPLSCAATVPVFVGVFGWIPHTLTDQRTDDDFTPSVNLQFDLTDNILTYFSFAQGFKAGGFDQQNRKGPLNPNDGGRFGPEAVDAYEIGVKTTWLDGAATLNVAVFRNEYDSLQVVGFDGTVNFLVDNAASATSQGVEIDARWAINDFLRTGLSVSFLDAEYDEFATAQCTIDQQAAANAAAIAAFLSRPGVNVPCTQDLSGADLQYAPAWSGNFNLEYSQPLPHGLLFVGQVDVNFTDDFFIRSDNDPNLIQDSFAKVNLRIALGGQEGDWDVALIGKNLNDELTTHSGDDAPLSPGSYFRFLDRPRQIGFQARYRW
ncbi:MAG: TonB-dependent receptor [Gammaproteobacteria bacterium]|nr:TonB-dependent receptor [Gammaproteobacteria bacterium]